MTRAIIYARVSTDRQRDINVSIPDQLNLCYQYIQKKGYQLVGNVFIDRISGKETSQDNPNSIQAFVDDYSGELYPRPGTNAALEFYDNHGGFDVLICKHRDRYTRSAQATYNMDYDFTDVRGVKIEFVDGFQNDDTPEGNLTAGFIDLMSEYENIRRAKRSKDGKLHYAKEKHILRSGGRSPFGYTFDKESLGGLKVEPIQAEIVRKIFKLYTKESYSIRGIAEYLNDNNIPSSLGPSKGLHWGKSSISNILSNTAYSGMVYYNRHRRIKNRMTNKITIKERDLEEWIEIPCHAIIDKKSFEEAQERMENNKLFVRNTAKRFYLLSGLIYCENCGKPYVCQSRRVSIKKRMKNESQSYRHRIKNGHCSNHTIAAKKIDELTWQNVEKLLLEPKALQEGFELARNRGLEINSKHIEQSSIIKKDLDHLEGTLKNLTRAYIDPEIAMSKEEYISQKSSLVDEIKIMKIKLKEIESLLSDIPTLEEYKDLEIFTNKISKRLTEPAYNPTPSNKRKIFDLLQIRVNVSPNGEIKAIARFGIDKGLSFTM